MIPSQPIITASQLGLLLQSARKTRKLTQAQLALRLGLSQNRLSELERNPGSMSVDQVMAICGHLGLQLAMYPRDAAAQAVPGAEW